MTPLEAAVPVPCEPCPLANPLRMLLNMIFLSILDRKVSEENEEEVQAAK